MECPLARKIPMLRCAYAKWLSPTTYVKYMLLNHSLLGWFSEQISILFRDFPSVNSSSEMFLSMGSKPTESLVY